MDGRRGRKRVNCSLFLVGQGFILAIIFRVQELVLAF